MLDFIGRTHCMFSGVLLLLSCFVFSACDESDPNMMSDPPENVTFPLTVRAEIDGRSELRIQGTNVWWHHFEFEAPGMWGDDQPTFLNGEEWWPTWPTDENANCNCDSGVEDVLGVALKADGSTISIGSIAARGTITIVQQPTAGNNFTASISFNDPEPDREWFQVTITQN